MLDANLGPLCRFPRIERYFRAHNEIRGKIQCACWIFSSRVTACCVSSLVMEERVRQRNERESTLSFHLTLLIGEIINLDRDPLKFLTSD